MSAPDVTVAGGPQQATRYELPRRISERIEACLPPGRGRANALRLAHFLGRYWALPSRLGDAFHVDRRALADRRDLGLTEKQVRRALAQLVSVGFLRPQPVRGSHYRATEDGLRRKPILYRFGSEWWSMFKHAARKAIATIKAALTKRAQKEHVSVSQVYLGPPRTPPPRLSEPHPGLEAAIDRLRKAAGITSDSSPEDHAK